MTTKEPSFLDIAGALKTAADVYFTAQTEAQINSVYADVKACVEDKLAEFASWGVSLHGATNPGALGDEAVKAFAPENTKEEAAVKLLVYSVAALTLIIESKLICLKYPNEKSRRKLAMFINFDTWSHNLFSFWKLGKDVIFSVTTRGSQELATTANLHKLLYDNVGALTDLKFKGDISLGLRIDFIPSATFKELYTILKEKLNL